MRCFVVLKSEVILRDLTGSDILLTTIGMTQVTEPVLLFESDKLLTQLELDPEFFPLFRMVQLS